MWSFILAILLGLTFLLTILIGCDRTTPNQSKIETIQVKTEGQNVKLNRKEIEKRLKELAKSTPPKELAIGAMCYDMAGPPDRAEYICPECGEKTLYTRDKSREVEWEIPKCRRLIQNSKSIPIKLDESGFCKKCKPDVSSPKLILIIPYNGGDNPHRAEINSSDDINLVIEFLEGKDKHRLFNNGERPLKDYIKRLEALLGVKID